MYTARKSFWGGPNNISIELFIYTYRGGLCWEVNFIWDMGSWPLSSVFTQPNFSPFPAIYLGGKSHLSFPTQSGASEGHHWPRAKPALSISRHWGAVRLQDEDWILVSGQERWVWCTCSFTVFLRSSYCVLARIVWFTSTNLGFAILLFELIDPRNFCICRKTF